jgi:hypothetical protein
LKLQDKGRLKPVATWSADKRKCITGSALFFGLPVLALYFLQFCSLLAKLNKHPREQNNPSCQRTEKLLTQNRDS